MKALFLIFLFIPAVSYAFTFEITNTSLQNSNAISLGVVGVKLCASSGLTPLNQLGDGTNNAICIQQRDIHSCKISIIMPVQIKLVSSEAYDIRFSKRTMGSDFEKISLRDTKDYALGGGNELLEHTTLMNNQTIIGELEITAAVCGSGVSKSYSNVIEVDISPTI